MSLLSRLRDTTTPTVTREPEIPIPPQPETPAKAGPEAEQLIRALDSLRHTVETRSTTPIAVRITVVDPETGAAHDIPLTRKQAQRLTDVAAEFANDYHHAAAEDYLDRVEQYQRVQAEEWDDRPQF